MENPLGFAHFLSNTDVVARIVLCLMLIASIGSWYLIVTKGLRGLTMRRRSNEFLTAFWEAPNLEAVAARIREKGTTEPFSHLVHHGFTAIEQHNRCKNGCECNTASLINAGNPEDLLTRALKRAIDEDKAQLEFGQTFLATVASSAPFVGLFGTVWGIYHALIAIGMSGQGTLDKVAGPVGRLQPLRTPEPQHAVAAQLFRLRRLRLPRHRRQNLTDAHRRTCDQRESDRDGARTWPIRHRRTAAGSPRPRRALRRRHES